LRLLYGKDGYDIRTVQELLGHIIVQTTMVYRHVLTRGARGVCRPLDGFKKAASSEGRMRPTRVGFVHASLNKSSAPRTARRLPLRSHRNDNKAEL
jgi:hypothetical protein